MPNTALAYRLVIPGPGSAFAPGDADADIDTNTDFYVTSLRRIDHPWIESAPGGEGTSLDIITGQITEGEVRLRVIDAWDTTDMGEDTEVGDDFEGDVTTAAPFGRGWTCSSAQGGIRSGVPPEEAFMPDGTDLSASWSMAGITGGLPGNVGRGLHFGAPAMGEVYGFDADNTILTHRTFTGLVPGARYAVAFSFWNNSYGIAFCGTTNAKAYVAATSDAGTVSWTQPGYASAAPWHTLATSDLQAVVLQQTARGDGTMDVTFGAVNINCYVQMRIGLDSVLLTLIPGSGAASGRIVTKWLADANARQQLLNRPAYVEVSADQGTTWTNPRRWYVVGLTLEESLVWEFSLGDTRRTERTRKAFRNIDPFAAGAPFTKITPVLGGPILGGLAPLVPDCGLPLYEVIAVDPMVFGVPGTLTLKFIAGPLPDDYNGRFPMGPLDGLETVQSRSHPFFLDGPIVGHDTDDPPIYYPLGTPLQGRYEGVRAYLCDPVTGAATAFPRMVPLGRKYFVGGKWVRVITYAFDKKITCELLLGPPSTLPVVGDRYGLMIAPVQISDEYPMHWSGHPVDFVITLYDLAGIAYDSGSAATCKASLGADLSCILRLTDPDATIQAVVDQICGFFRFVVRGSAGEDARVFVHFGQRIDATPAVTIETADLGQGGPTFELATDSMINRVVVQAAQLAAFVGNDRDARPFDALVVSQASEITFDYSADGGVTLDADEYGEREVTFALPGSVAWSPGPTPLDLTVYAAGLARDVFSHSARGVQYATLALVAGKVLDVGDAAAIDVDHMPNAQLGQSPISQRGGVRWMRNVRREGSAAFQKYRFADESTGVAYGEVVTLALGDNADDPLHSKDLEITGTAQFVTDGACLEIELAFGVSSPAGHGVRYTILAPEDLPADPWTEVISNLPEGENVWVRARGFLWGGAPGTWSAWTETGSSAPAPSGSLSALTLGTPTTDGVDLSWTNTNTTHNVKVEVRLDTATAYTFAASLAPGSIQYTLAGLLDATDYDVRVILTDAVTGVEAGSALTDSFTTDTLAGATTLATPTRVRIYGGVTYATGVVSPGEFGLICQAVVGPPGQMVEFEMAVETSIGSGTPGAYSVIAIFPAAAGDIGTRSACANDGKLRYMRARATALGYTASSYTGVLSVDPWATTPAPPATGLNLADLGDAGGINAPVIGDVLGHDGTEWGNYAFDYLLGFYALDDLGDVDAPAPNDGDLLAWNSTSGMWEPVTAPASQDTFATIAVAGQSDVVADGVADTLTLAAGSNITLTTNAGTDTVTISASGAASPALDDITDVNAPSPADRALLQFDSGASEWVDADPADVVLRAAPWFSRRHWRHQTNFAMGAFETMTCPTINGVGSTAADGAAPYVWMKLTSGAVSGNVASLLAGSFTWCSRDLGAVWVAFVKTGSNISDVRYWMGLFQATPTAASDPAIHLAAFRYDTGADGTAFWRTCTKDGSTMNAVASSIAITVDTNYLLRIETDASEVRFYVDGGLVATHTTNLPGASQTLGPGVAVTTLTDAAKHWRYGRMEGSYLG